MSKITSGLKTFDEVEPGEGLKAALRLKRTQIISAISEAGLKGRGGAGFPTAVKWNLAAAARSEHKAIICNADEGEPGTFKDRMILLEHPELAFEGMCIAARAAGANRGILYLRGEYTYLLEKLNHTLAEMREAGRLGKNIEGTEGFNFDIEIHLGSGAYVCGEETALIESLEGNRGEPRNRPPFPVDTGLHGEPSIVNNVETLCWATCIVARGADWFRSYGTQKSPGLKLLSISGDVEKPGVYECALGVAISEVLAVVGATDAKAVQVGGASGVCVPQSGFDRRIAFEDISTGGSIIVYGPERDMLDVLENVQEFFCDESCGQCTPCREGNVVLLDGVRRLKAGKCSMSYLNELCALGETMQVASKCGLGQSSPNCFLSIVEHFQHEIMGRVPTAASQYSSK